MTIIDERIIKAMEFIASYAKDVDDWVVIKIQILRSVPSHLRTSFSTRDQKTKKQWLNDFDKLVIEKWKEMTGVELKIKERAPEPKEPEIDIFIAAALENHKKKQR